MLLQINFQSSSLHYLPFVRVQEFPKALSSIGTWSHRSFELAIGKYFHHNTGFSIFQSLFVSWE
jgi:hypothetical protein